MCKVESTHAADLAAERHAALWWLRAQARRTTSNNFAMTVIRTYSELGWCWPILPPDTPIWLRCLEVHQVPSELMVLYV
jgi:hypothetical protein